MGPKDLKTSSRFAEDFAVTWKAKLQLEYQQRGTETYLARVQHEGPYVVQKSFSHPTSEMLHSYLLHPPGGLVGGDELYLNAQFAQGASALLTTPAAGKIYRTPALASRSGVELQLAPESSVFWLPQENIVFHGANHQSSVHIKLGARARATLWDVTCFGRPGANELYEDGLLQTEVLVEREGKPLLLERMRYPGGSPHMSKPWGLSGKTVVASLILTWPQWPDLSVFLGDLSNTTVEAGATLRNEVYIVRARADCAYKVRALFTELIEALSLALDGKAFEKPRIWAY